MRGKPRWRREATATQVTSSFPHIILTTLYSQLFMFQADSHLTLIILDKWLQWCRQEGHTGITATEGEDEGEKESISPTNEHQNGKEDNGVTGDAGGRRTPCEAEDGECLILLPPRVPAVVIIHGAVVICKINTPSAHWAKQKIIKVSGHFAVILKSSRSPPIYIRM